MSWAASFCSATLLDSAIESAIASFVRHEPNVQRAQVHFDDRVAFGVLVAGSMLLPAARFAAGCNALAAGSAPLATQFCESGCCEEPPLEKCGEQPTANVNCCGKQARSRLRRWLAGSPVEHVPSPKSRMDKGFALCCPLQRNFALVPVGGSIEVYPK